MIELFSATRTADGASYNVGMEQKTMYGDTMGGRAHMARRNKGLTSQDVSRLVGFGLSQISNVENNKSNPSLTLLMALADVYGVTLGWLAGRPDEPMTINAEPDTVGISPEAEEVAHIVDNLPHMRAEILAHVRLVADMQTQRMGDTERMAARAIEQIKVAGLIVDDGVLETVKRIAVWLAGGAIGAIPDAPVIKHTGGGRNQTRRGDAVVQFGGGNGGR